MKVKMLVIIKALLDDYDRRMQQSAMRDESERAKREWALKQRLQKRLRKGM